MIKSGAVKFVEYLYQRGTEGPKANLAISKLIRHITDS